MLGSLCSADHDASSYRNLTSSREKVNMLILRDWKLRTDQSIMLLAAFTVNQGSRPSMRLGQVAGVFRS